MRTLLVTGGIGGGKSEVCRYLSSKGFPVYDSDSRTKALYDADERLRRSIDSALGPGLLLPDGSLDRKALAAAVFSDPVKLSTLESIVHPAVLEDFKSWREAQTADAVVLESAIVLDLPLFDGVYDTVFVVDAPVEIRVERACRRDGASPRQIRERIERQKVDLSRADAVILNDSTFPELCSRVDEALRKNSIFAKQFNRNIKMKTDLSRILSVSGQHGLFRYIAQSRGGVIAESLETGKRVGFDARARITTLADIAIFTSEGELRLRNVFEALHEALGDSLAPSAKASSDELKALFIKAVPDYDEDRFYVSHMKKVVEWYNCLAQFASLEFTDEEEEEAETETSEDPAND